MSKEKKLFKEDKEEPRPRKSKTSKFNWFLIFTAIKLRLNTLILWITILFNGLLIVFMIFDFNIGIFLFILNQYLVIKYWIKLRKEREEKKKRRLAKI